MIKGDKMNKRNILVTSSFFLSLIMLFSSVIPTKAVIYPYSVETGDKIPYNCTILKNGSYTGWLMVKGLNLSSGDNFEMEIFDRPANPTLPYGTQFTIRFVKGEENGDTFSAQSVIFTNNKKGRFFKFYWSSGYPVIR